MLDANRLDFTVSAEFHRSSKLVIYQDNQLILRSFADIIQNDVVVAWELLRSI